MGEHFAAYVSGVDEEGTTCGVEAFQVGSFSGVAFPFVY